MTTVQKILDALQTLAPTYMKYEWDNVGLLCGRRDRPVRKILVALDPFEDVCREAVELGADLIVTHHPLIFQPVRSITRDDPVGRCILLLAAHDIAAVNAHTNLDCAPGGVNDVLARTLGLTDIQVAEPMGQDEAGRPYGLLRTGLVEEMDLPRFLDRVKERLHTPVLRYVDGGKPVRRVAVGGGACGDEYGAALSAGCDTLVTADVKYNQFRDAFDLGLNLIDAGHFYTENPVMEPVARQLQERFPEVEVILSQKHTDCMKFW